MDVNGSRENNAVLSSGEAFGPFLDGRPGVSSDERFKANMNAHETVDGRRRRGLMGYVSADGVHWKPVKSEMLIRGTLPNHFDSQNVMFWSEAEECPEIFGDEIARIARWKEGGDAGRLGNPCGCGS